MAHTPHELAEEFPEFVGDSFIDGFGLFVNGENVAFANGDPINVNHPDFLGAFVEGEGGEFEVNPERPCQATVVVEGEEAQFRIANDSSHYDDKAASPNTEHLVKLWQGQDHSQYGHDAVLRTAALALCAMLKTTDYVSALSQCSKAWAERDKSLLA